MDAVAVLQLVKDTVAAEHYEVMLAPIDAEGKYIGIGNNDTFVAFQSLELGLDITKRSANRETPGEDSVGP